MRTLLAKLVLVAFVCALVSACASVDTIEQPNIKAAANQLKSGEIVHLETVHGREIRMTIVAVKGGNLVGLREEVPISDIRSMDIEQVANENSILRNVGDFLVGAATLAAFLYGFKIVESVGL